MEFNSIARFFPLLSTELQPTSVTDIGAYVKMPAGYVATNPSFAPYGDGYIVSVRGVNYAIKDRVSLEHSFRTGATFHTVNRFVLVDDNLKLVRELPGLGAATDNIEDIRLFAVAGSICAIGSRPSQARSRMVFLAFSNDLAAVDVRELPSPYGLPREKNWCPFVRNDRVHFLYSRTPLVVLRYEPEASEPLVIVQGPGTPSATRILDSGSSAGVAYDGGTLFLMHRRRVDLPSMRRTYLTRACHLSDDMRAISCGPYFSIGAPTIQFANGLAIGSNDVIIAYGEMDSAALIARIPRSEFFRRALPRLDRAANARALTVDAHAS